MVRISEIKKRYDQKKLKKQEIEEKDREISDEEEEVDPNMFIKFLNLRCDCSYCELLRTMKIKYIHSLV